MTPFKLSDLLTNISGLAALAIILAAVTGFVIALAASALGHPLDANAFALVTKFGDVLIGLAIGAGAGGSALALRAYRAMEMNAIAAQSHLKPE
jgi:hypothetical protein